MIKSRINCPHCGKGVNFEVSIEKPLRRLRGPTTGGRPRAFADEHLLKFFPAKGQGVNMTSDAILKRAADDLGCGVPTARKWARHLLERDYIAFGTCCNERTASGEDVLFKAKGPEIGSGGPALTVEKQE